MTRAYLIPALAVAALVLGASPASAGFYDVKACHTPPGGEWIGNASWAPEAPNGFAAAYTQCPGEGIVSRMSVGGGTAPYGSGARQVFTAPPGTRIVRFNGNVNVTEFRGWHAGLVDSTPRWVWCGGSCTSYGQYWWVDWGLNTQQLFAQVTCGDFNGCPRWHLDGLMAMRDVIVTLEDTAAPGIAITGGLTAPSGWLRGDQVVRYDAWDGSGISVVDLFIDGRQGGSQPGNCHVSRAKRCDDQARSAPIPANLFGADGPHRVTLRAQDAVFNRSATERTVWVDNTAPAQPQNVELVGSSAWRTRNGFSFRWRNPQQAASPIEGARYRLCPSATPPGELQGCIDGTRKWRDIATLDDIRVPASGEWRITLWLEDAAGNADHERSVTVSSLRFDDRPPAVAFAEPSENDPTRVRVRATDVPAGIALAQIEARRHGENVWRALETAPDKTGFTAILDDEKLPRGVYDLRARAVDAAGNERTIDAMPDGRPAQRRLPARISTRLAVGKRTRVRARGAHGRHRYRTVLRIRPSAQYGRTIPLAGRLTMPGANPLANAPVHVWERVNLQGARWKRVSQLRTSRTGRFRFKALKGPSRTIRFRYPGTATIRPRSAEVTLRVRALTTLRVNRTSLLNGEEVRFRGRLKGHQTGVAGKLVQLQVYTRGRWSTFATPRASPSSGRWTLAYRFTGTRGRVRYRFRAVVPREASFPYETGVSHAVHVTVRGL